VLCVALFTSASAGCASFHQGPLPHEPKKTAWGPAHFVTIDGTRVHYVDVGEGPPVVLVHGFASSLNAWAGLIEALKKTHRVVALDLKGFGWTDRPEGDYSPRAQAKLVVGLMDALGIDHADVVAHSWGSSVTLELALDAPKRVDRIALYDAWVYEDQLPTFFLWARAGGVGEALFGMFYDERPDDKIAGAFYDKKYVTEELVESVEEQLDRPGTTAAALAAVRGQRYADVEKKYATIDKPVLLLWGREDKVTTLEYGERLSKDLPRAKLVVYPQCGHFPMIEAKAPSTRELVEFLKEPFAAGESAAKAPQRSEAAKEKEEPKSDAAPKSDPPKSDPPKTDKPTLKDMGATRQ
jgi:pimeloyl-ACP methyl ester carboxylesterase